MDSLTNLIQLHEANQRLKEIHELKGNLPEVLDTQKLELKEINQNQAQNNSELKDLNGKAVNNQTALSDSNSKLEKYNEQLFNVTNTKEYEALILETDQLKELITNLNQELSDANNQVSVLEQNIESNQEKIEQLSQSITENEKVLSMQMADTDKEEQLLLKHKESIESKVNTQDLALYTKLFNKYGQGMAEIVRKSCSSCYTQLPAQTIVEIEYNKKIISCPSCTVFLYHKNEQD